MLNNTKLTSPANKDATSLAMLLPKKDLHMQMDQISILYIQNRLSQWMKIKISSIHKIGYGSIFFWGPCRE